MKKMPEIEISFLLSSDDDESINYITEELNIMPTKTRCKDSYKFQEFAKASWELSTGVEHCKAISIQFYKIKHVLKDKEMLINLVSQKFNLSAIFVVVIHAEIGDGPEIVIPKEIIKFASQINAEIHFDTYFY